METVEAYLDRKQEELGHLNECLRHPLPLTRPRSVAEVVEQKFRLTAALKAEHALMDWAATETAWAPVRHRSGPFEFTYDYQRADLMVEGPSFYGLDCGQEIDTIYAGSGMAAIAALVLAAARLVGNAGILTPPGSYGETLELIEGYARQFQLLEQDGALREHSCQIVLLDSSLPISSFEAVLRGTSAKTDLLIFDTTCFSANSKRIRRVMNWTRGNDIPLVMVRSHTKLDSLGAEYGRLGSATFVRHLSAFGSHAKFNGLPDETRNAVRLLGGAALPAHFPPYAGTPAYRDLTSRRMALILRNSRRASRYLATKLAGLTAEIHYAHGLYVTLQSATSLSEETARQAAMSLSEDLGSRGFPIRHAGSFGFDFAATEWFQDRRTDQYVVRVAVPDLPTPIWDELSNEVANWWLMHEGSISGGTRVRSSSISRVSGRSAPAR